jgi:hypothetical protein
MAADDWALSVGIADYLAKQALPGLPGARADARRFHAWVSSPTGGAVPPAQCKLLVSPDQISADNPAPLAHEIEAWFKARHRAALLNERARTGFTAGGRLYVFVAGHGLAVGAAREAVLLSADADPPDISDHVAVRLWADWFRDAGAFREVVLIADCCRSESRRVPPRPPPWAERLSDRGPARHFYAFAAVNNAAAREVVIGDQSAGLFTTAVLELLEDPARRPLSASALKGRLYGHPRLHGDHTPDIDVPPNPAHDFVIVEAAAGARGQAPPGMPVAIYDAATPAGEALAIATRLAGGHAVALADLTESSLPRATNLVLATRGLPASTLDRILASTAPDRIVALDDVDLPADMAPPVHRIGIDAADSPALAQVRVDAATAPAAVPTARLVVRGADPYVRLRVWTAAGDLIAEARGSLDLKSIPHGAYVIGSSFGRCSVVSDWSLDGDAEVELPAFALATPLPLPDSRWWTDADRAWLAAQDTADLGAIVVARVDAAPPAGVAWRVAERIARGAPVELEVEGHRIALAVPVRAGERAELYVHGADVAIRIVPAAHALGAPLPGDRIRETLRLACVDQGPGDPPAPDVDPAALAGDPIAALLALALARAPIPALLRVAQDGLGAAAADVRAWSADAVLARPPLVRARWADVAIEPGSAADELVGREVELGPWLAWSVDDAPWQRGWLPALAAIMWPGWDRDADPDPDAAALPKLDLDAAARRLGAPSDSVRRRTYKSPPIERLRPHEVIGFAGASNDQLPAALAIAFVERDQRRWRELVVWSLDDDRLDRMTSDGRAGPRLRRARDRAELELRRLLPQVAERWRLVRYRGLDVAPHGWSFASLWDWTVPGVGFVGLSPYDAGADVRTAPAIETTWAAGAAAPPADYAATVAAYATLAPTRVIGEG